MKKNANKIVGFFKDIELEDIPEPKKISKKMSL